MTCANCFHEKENHKGICNGSLTCLCQQYIEPVLMEFAHDIEKIKHEFKSVMARVKYILKNYPSTRNASDKTFPEIYKEIYHGIKLRKDYNTLTRKKWKTAPCNDYINRAKRKVKQHNPDLRTYDKKFMFEQSKLFLAMQEIAIEEN